MIKKQQQQVLDAVVEIVHQGYGRLIDCIGLVNQFAHAMKPNCSANYEYAFTWNHECDPDSIKINWKRLNRRLLRLVIKQSSRLKKITEGSCLTVKEKKAYRLAIARQKYGYRTAEERLRSEQDLKWADLSYLTDSKGRRIYLLEIGDANTTSDEEVDSMAPKKAMEWLDRVWHWKSQPLTLEGPFVSEEEAEAWMTANGAFDDE